jgi:hypothetical protein
MYGLGFGAFRHAMIGSIGGGGVNAKWDGIQAYYKLDNTALDSVNTNDLTLVNGTTYATGKVNNGLTFDGVNDYASIPTSLFDFTGDFTINMWVNFATVATYGLWQNSGGANFGFIYSVGNKFRYVGPNDYTILISTTVISANTWYMLTITRKTSTRTRMYINGALEVSDTVTANYASNTVGRRLGTFYNGQFFNGKMDEVSFFNTEKTAAEITELYNGGSPTQYPL